MLALCDPGHSASLPAHATLNASGRSDLISIRIDEAVMVRDILIMLAAVAMIVAFAPKVSQGVNTPASEATSAPVTAGLQHDGHKDR
jgi:hypothetical protein